MSCFYTRRLHAYGHRPVQHQKPRTSCECATLSPSRGRSGWRGRTRTCNYSGNNRVLYQLSYPPRHARLSEPSPSFTGLKIEPPLAVGKPRSHRYRGMERAYGYRTRSSSPWGPDCYLHIHARMLGQATFRWGRLPSLETSDGVTSPRFPLCPRRRSRRRRCRRLHQRWLLSSGRA